MRENGSLDHYFVRTCCSVGCGYNSLDSFSEKTKPAMSIAAAVVGAVSGAKAISMFIMFGFITDLMFVAYLVIIVYLNYKKNTKSAANNIENGFTESKQDS